MEAMIDQYVNIGATGAVVIVMVWGITKGLPSLINEFRTELSNQRGDFREELKEHRLQSRQLAESGHTAVNNLAKSFNELKTELVVQRETQEHDES